MSESHRFNKYFQKFSLVNVRSTSNELVVSETAEKIGASHGFEIKSYGFTALKEDLRKPRIVKIGAVQNSIVVSTSKPIHEQRDAIFQKIGHIIDAAGAEGVNVLCLQEAWSEFASVKFEKYFFLSFFFVSIFQQCRLRFVQEVGGKIFRAKSNERIKQSLVRRHLCAQSDRLIIDCLC